MASVGRDSVEPLTETVRMRLRRASPYQEILKRRSEIAAIESVAARFPLQLRFAFVQRLQPQLPAMQLDRELIDVSGHFGALRFVFLQLSLNFVNVRDRAGVGRFRNRNRGCVAAFLAGQVHACGVPRGYQRGFAMLAMKENIGIGLDFADGMHPEETSRGCAGVDRDLRARLITPSERSFHLQSAAPRCPTF